MKRSFTEAGRAFRKSVEDERSTILYTNIESCRARSLVLWAYLHDVLTHLPTMTNRQVKDITPNAWAETQKPETTSRVAISKPPSTRFSRRLA